MCNIISTNAEAGDFRLLYVYTIYVSPNHYAQKYQMENCRIISISHRFTFTTKYFTDTRHKVELYIWN